MGQKISVFGLGYVGSVTAACLASKGHQVLGVDLNPAKINAVEPGMSTARYKRRCSSRARDGHLLHMRGHPKPK